MSIFPFLDVDTAAVAASTSLATLKEYTWDFEQGDFSLQDGKLVVVEGLEAIKVWIYKALTIERYRYLIYTWDYGNELDTLIGANYSRAATQSEAKRYIEEALLVNPYINAVKDVSASFDGEKLCITFTTVTDYGEATVSV